MRVTTDERLEPLIRFCFREKPPCFAIACYLTLPGGRTKFLTISDLEKAACAPIIVEPICFNPKAKFPYGLTVAAVRKSMEAFIDFLGFLNRQLLTRELPRIEMLMMPANFSSLVGEFVVTSIPKHCPGLVKNRFHNGHPDLIPTGRYPGDLILHAQDGIEVKASRYSGAWQGHNPEKCWLMVFVFQANSSSAHDAEPVPFRFRSVYLARLKESDWRFSGRSETSRRTITASVTKSGEAKLRKNWIYSAQ